MFGSNILSPKLYLNVRKSYVIFTSSEFNSNIDAEAGMSSAITSQPEQNFKEFPEHSQDCIDTVALLLWTKMDLYCIIGKK